MNATHEEAVEFAKISKRENRVYVGNLSYDVKYRDLMEFMRGAGEVLFAEVLVTPTGVSKGCGIVEFASPEDAQRAIRELSEVAMLGRPVFIREVRLPCLVGAIPTLQNRTGRTSRASALRLSQARLEWLWQGKVCMRSHLHVHPIIIILELTIIPAISYMLAISLIKLVGRTSRICSVRLVILFGLILILVRMGVPRAPEL
jgi:hypothetical protein